MKMVHRRDGPSLTIKTLTEMAVTCLDGDQPIEARVAAFQTSPMPPAPRADKISYGPSRVPGVRAIEVVGIIEDRLILAD